MNITNQRCSWLLEIFPLVIIPCGTSTSKILIPKTSLSPRLTSRVILIMLVGKIFTFVISLISLYSLHVFMVVRILRLVINCIKCSLDSLLKQIHNLNCQMTFVWDLYGHFWTHRVRSIKSTSGAQICGFSSLIDDLTVIVSSQNLQ